MNNNDSNHDLFLGGQKMAQIMHFLFECRIFVLRSLKELII